MLTDRGAGQGTSRLLSFLLLYVVEDPDNFARCRNCNMELVRVIPENSLPRHIGHRLEQVDYFRFWERVWIKLKWL